MNQATGAPKRRSRFRKKLGRIYYSLKRLQYWYFSGTDFATTVSSPLEHTIVAHRTPLLRRLRDVDMQLQYNKIHNLKLAASRINGIIIHPGQVFSFWYLVRNPSRLRGYKTGMVLEDGRVAPGTGGGLCQMSNLIFWMTLHTPLTVIERHRHSYDVFPDSDRKLPFGSGATCAYNYIDLQIKNETDHVYQLVVWLDGTHLNGEWRSGHPREFRYDVFDKDHSIQHEFWGGYVRSNKLCRRVHSESSGELLSEEFLFENHALMMYSPLLDEKKYD